ncbi:hypothetical protein GOODEAATRI_007701 [Goodea atripinnis]|uniref:Uncharacterized protein n=1 Tax=Goodea atripinnis TaxID=208336 RepID=A0ABV0PWI6_9TELE
MPGIRIWASNEGLYELTLSSQAEWPGFLLVNAIDGQKQEGITVYQLNLKETKRDAASSEAKMGWFTNNLVEDTHLKGELMNLVPMENSPRPGRARQELIRWPSLSGTSRPGSRKEEVIVEEVVDEKMKTDRFLKQPSKNSKRNLDVAELRVQTDTQKQSLLPCSVTIRVERPVRGGHATIKEHNSLPRAMLRRPKQNEDLLSRRATSMYGSPVEQQKDSQPNQERLLGRPRSVCMLSEPLSQQLFKREEVLLKTQQLRSKKAELRAVDGLNRTWSQYSSGSADVPLRSRQRSWKPRPLSMTVLELRKRGSDDEIDSQRNCNRTGNDGGFFRGGFRWKLFGKTPQDVSKDKDVDKDTTSFLKSNKSDASKTTLTSLRRSFSLRIRRNRSREKIDLGSEGEFCQIKSSAEETTTPPQPFSYLTGKALPASCEPTDDGGMQYIQYHSRGKAKVLEVPLCPTKLSSKPVQEEQSLWQLIASRFRRKDQPNKCESQPPQNKDSGQHPKPGNNKAQPITIETLAGTNYHKGQGVIIGPCIEKGGLHRGLRVAGTICSAHIY